MGSGTITLLLYVACCGVVVFVGATAAILYAYGRRAERRKRRQADGEDAPPEPGA